MAEYTIKNFSEIDVVNIDPVRDSFILPDGKKYRFSDYMCDSCWSGGTVLQSDRENKIQYYCILCNNFLKWYEFLNDFLPPKGDVLRFLLPKSWSKKEVDEWYKSFMNRRIQEENVRKNILESGKE